MKKPFCVAFDMITVDSPETDKKREFNWEELGRISGVKYKGKNLERGIKEQFYFSILIYMSL